MKLSTLLAALPRHRLAGSADVEITEIVFDSRQVTPGALFVAYQGVSVDGHAFMPQALERGAVAVVREAHSLAHLPGSGFPVITVPDGRQALACLSAAWHDFPSRKLTLVGVTGTDGKTTTSHLLFSILKAAGIKAGLISTVSAVIGEERYDIGPHTTTPDAPDVQRYLAQMVEAGAEVCVLEVTSHGLAQQRVAACAFDIAVITNITHEHLDLHGSLDGYWAAKAKLFEGLDGTRPKTIPPLAVLNADDGSYDYLRARLKVRHCTYGLGPAADVVARDVRHEPGATRFQIAGPGYTKGVASKLVGAYNVSNMLAAFTAAVEGLGVDPAAGVAGLAALDGIAGRMERIDAGQDFLAIVDFAHTPNALRRSLETARTMIPPGRRLIAVFGSAGLRDREKRTLMGQIAADLADLTLITAEDPRTEDLDSIIEETAQAMLARGCLEGRDFERVPDRGRAIFRATQLAQPGDLVIALGKGHEQSMCFGTTEYPWDDRQALRAALSGKPLLTLPTGR
ncbi:MAG: UDP-N-acetylmuramoyl-L-alanyl-D-glutamate--2,6-diaminopimelate ligase [Anaerolineae bacterium]